MATQGVSRGVQGSPCLARKASADVAQQALTKLIIPLQRLHLNKVLDDVVHSLCLQQVQVVLLGKQRPL